MKVHSTQYHWALALLCALTLVLALPAVHAQAAANAGDYAIYIVQQGQTLASIAAEQHVAVAELALYNRMGLKDALTTGQVLLVPEATETSATPPQQTIMTTPVVTTPTAPTAQPAQPTTTSAPPSAPAGDTVSGVIGAITAERTQILNRPVNGQVLFDKATRGLKLLVVGQNGDYYAVLMEEGTTGWVAKSDLALTSVTKTVPKPQPAPAPVVGRMDVVEAARRYLGVRYEYGGKLPNTVDCSLLVQTAFKSLGVNLPRTAAEQSQIGAAVKVEELVPGDRLYFYKRNTNEIGHTGIYAGNGQFIHASSNRGMVAIDNLGDNTYWSIFAWARR